MTSGYMFFDDDPDTTLAQKIARAAESYRKKCGRTPELCLIHPNMLNGEKLDVEGVTVRPWRYILPHHLWLGFEKMPTEPKESRPV